jgi:tRNA dimethylallyltransferase
MENGLEKEVKSLIPYQNKNALQTVGYKELFEYFGENCSLDQSTEMIKQNTRRFAKRQITWFKKDSSTTYFSPNNKDEIIRFIG